MAKLTSVIYQTLLATYKAAPLKKQICQAIRATGVPVTKFYRDLTFEEPFDTAIDEGHQFSIYGDNSPHGADLFWNGLYGFFDGESIPVLAELARRSEVVFDIGANVGIQALVIKSVNPGVRLYAFEPIDRVRAILQKNIALNNYDVTIEKYAVSNVSGPQVIYDMVASAVPYSASLNGNFFQHSPQTKVAPVNIETITLDNYIRNNNINKIDLIKIDVETFEPEVIEGFSNISAYRPWIILEVLTPKVADRLNSIFRKLDFDIYLIQENGQLLKTNEFKQLHDILNYVVCPPEKTATLQSFISA